ncbi:MAG: DUF3307 domain-containing protein [Candidatus Gracilibacteria bacterium]
MIFLHLIVAHLLGDFVFQSNDLLQRKYKSWMGIFQHACIISALTILSIFPYLQHAAAWQVISIIFGMHFVQDHLKIELDARYNKKKNTLPFFADQIFHVALIYVLSLWLTKFEPLSLPDWLENLYSSYSVTIYLIGAVLFSYAYDIALYQFLRKRSKKKLEYTANIPSMLRRIAIFSVIYLLILVSAGNLM